MRPPFDPWLTLHEHPGRVVRLVREDVPFESLAEVEIAYGSAAETLERMPRAQMAFVMDLRRAPSRNDPGFERTIAPLRKRLFAGFGARGVLVRSAVGKLQIKRHAAADGFHDLEVYTDLEEAIGDLHRGA